MFVTIRIDNGYINFTLEYIKKNEYIYYKIFILK